jgi:hypothetical protein
MCWLEVPTTSCIMDCLLHPHHNRNVVLVSSPESVIQGVNCRLGGLWDVPRGNKKAGRFLLGRQVSLSLGTANAGFMRPGDQMEGKIPKALALATACVRLWTPSLRANSNPPVWQKPYLLGSCYRLSATMYIEFAIDIAGVGLDRVQREEKPGSDLLIG